MPLKKNRKKKTKIIETAADIFFTKVKQVERRLWQFLDPLMATLNRKGGRFENDDFNRGRLMTVEPELLSILMGPEGIGGDLPRYLENFDEVERYNRLIYEDVLSESMAARLSRLTFASERTFLVDDLTRAFTSTDMITQNLVVPIRRVLYSGIQFRQRVNDVAANLRAEVLTTSAGNSKVLRYARQIAQDAITQFDGAINDRIRDDLDLDGISYLGAIILDSRYNCVHLVNGTEIFADLAIAPGIYAVKDIPEIVTRASRNPGWNHRCTAETFGQYRGGFNCNHEVIYFLLDDEQAQKRVLASNP